MPSFLSSLMPLCVAQAWLLALLAAQKDDRLALLHLGHVHHQGLHGLPTDPDLAYAYYANIAKQTALDRQNPTPQQVMCAFVTGCFGMHISFKIKNNIVLPYIVLKAFIGVGEGSFITFLTHKRKYVLSFLSFFRHLLRPST